MRAYQELLGHVLTAGVDRVDRTGVGTRSVFGYQMRVDLADGFPLLTTKKVHTKSIIAELLWFLQGDTNVTTLQEQGVTIWDGWRRPYRLDRPMVDVVARAGLLSSQYRGDFTPDTDTNPDLVAVWKRMMRACYDPTDPSHLDEGARGVTVADRWHSAAAFCEDATALDHYWYWKHNPRDFVLSPDYYGARQYGPGSSVWLHRDEQDEYRREEAPTLGDSTVETPTSLPAPVAAVVDTLAALVPGDDDEHPTEPAPLHTLRRRELIPQGDLGPVYSAQWRRFGAGPDGRGGVDQISQVIHDLRTDPFSRRHVVSAWNPVDVPDMALPPCHTLFQFYVTPDADGRPDTLSCQVYQRSGDVFLGVPFNIASYSLLTHIIAKQVGLRPGEFVHTLGDAHLYLNHLDQAREQMEREPRPLPTLHIADRPTLPGEPLPRYEVGDFTFEGYHPHPKIDAPVAI